MGNGERERGERESGKERVSVCMSDRGGGSKGKRRIVEHYGRNMNTKKGQFNIQSNHHTSTITEYL